MVFLAQELIEAIVDEIDASAETDLRSFSLVARNFAPPSQRRLFRYMDFGRAPETLLHRAIFLLSFSEKISSYVRDLSLECNPDLSTSYIQALTAILQALHNLRRLSISRLEWNHTPPNLQLAITAAIAQPSLHSLHIISGTIPVHILVHAVASVRHLNLGVSVDRTGHESNSEVSIPAPSLTELHLTVTNIATNFDSTVLPDVFPRPLALTRLSLFFIWGPPHPHAILDFAAMSATTLQHLSLAQLVMPEPAAPPSLPHLSALTSLELRSLFRIGEYTLGAILATVPHPAGMPHVEFLTIGLLRPQAMSPEHDPLTSDFDARLLTWPCLRECRFTVLQDSGEVDGADSTFIEFINSNLPKAWEKGILAIPSTRSE